MPPTVVTVRGPSGSGKTSLIEAVLPLLARDGLRAAALKRSHHTLDLPGKDSGRLAAAGATAVLVHDAAGTAIFRQPTAALTTLLGLLPSETDLAFVETFRPERYPVLLAETVAIAPGETLLGRFALPLVPAEVDAIAGRLRTLVDARAHAAAAPPGHKPHRCAGAVLGRRLAAYGAALLGLALPCADGRLFVLCENDGCTADALVAATGCHPGSRSLRFTYQGKLAATFVDTLNGQAVRVHARGDLRGRAAGLYPETDRHIAQLLAYEVLSDEELFGFRPAPVPWLPARRPTHAVCMRCDEEVDGDIAVRAGEAALCRDCLRAVDADQGLERTGMLGQEGAR